MVEAPLNLYQALWIVGAGIIILQIAVVGFFLKEQAKALKENTYAVIALKTQMEMILKEFYKIPKMERDLNNLGSKVRSYDS